MAVGRALRVISDAEAVELCRRGDQEGFRALLQAHQEYVFLLCWRMTGDRHEAMDLTQEVFLRVIRALPGLHPRPSVRPWLRRVAVNLCLNTRDARERHAALELRLRNDPGGDGARAGSDPVGEAVASREQVDRIALLLRQLRAQERAALVLSAVEGLKCSQIAGILGAPLGTVKSHLSRARARLRQVLSEEGEDRAGNPRLRPG